VNSLHENRHLIDWLAWAFAGVSVYGFLQGFALVVTILAGLGSLSLVGMRWYDRRKYGPGKS